MKYILSLAGALILAGSLVPSAVWAQQAPSSNKKKAADILIIEEDSTFVEISVGDQEFEKKQIKTGLSDGIQIEVLSGIDTATQIKVMTHIEG